jgi:dolichol kinase
MTGRQVAGQPAGRAPLPAGIPLRTPRAAAVAGIVFSVLLIFMLVVLRTSTPGDPGSAGTWLTDSARRALVAVALNLVPFAGIAFLWFMLLFPAWVLALSIDILAAGPGSARRPITPGG